MHLFSETYISTQIPQKHWHVGILAIKLTAKSIDCLPLVICQDFKCCIACLQYPDTIACITQRTFYLLAQQFIIYKLCFLSPLISQSLNQEDISMCKS